MFLLKIACEAVDWKQNLLKLYADITHMVGAEQIIDIVIIDRVKPYALPIKLQIIQDYPICNFLLV